jgi:thiol-disulfide isomerase/thioredoxin
MDTPVQVSRRYAIATFLLALGAERLAAVTAGEPAPHFVAKTLDGERLTSESLRGKVVLVEFWATWCPPCKSDAPAVDALAKEFEKDGLVVLAVNMGEPRRKVKKYLETYPRSCKIILAEDTTLAAICEAKAYPLYVLIDRDSRIAGTQTGAAGEGALRRLLARAGLEAE